MTPEPDGDLAGARQHLADAITALCDPKRHTLATGKHTWLDSTYTQLADAVYEKHALGGGRMQPASPLWIAASDCLHDINHAARVEHPDQPTPTAQRGVQGHQPMPPAVWRLHQIDARTWRPQDCRHIIEFTTTIERHTITAENLLNPPTHWHLPNPCPLCGLAFVYVDDSGDQIRRPALSINEHYCRCANTECKGFWSQKEFPFLGRLLGNRPPEGVVNW